MGIQDFYDMIEEHCPQVLTKVKMSEMCGLKVAVDISIFLNKYVKTAGPEYWLDNFTLLLCTLKKSGIKPVCIFDGPNPPIEKRAEQDRRRSEAAKKAERIAYGRRLIALLKTKYRDMPIDEEMVAEIKSIIGTRREKVAAINYDDVQDVIASMIDALDRQTKQNSPILPEYGAKAKRLIQYMGFSHFQADGEAETLCSAMCSLGMVDAVLSEDTDVLAYGSPFLMSKIDLAEQTVTVISHEEILAALEFTHEEFLDLCILMKCDYNQRVKGYPPDGRKRKKPIGIGVKGAFLMISEYRRLEDAERYMEDPDLLNYRRCRELFTLPTSLPNITIPYNGPIDRKNLALFLGENRIRTSMEYILDTWKPTTMTFVSSTEVLSDEE